MDKQIQDYFPGYWNSLQFFVMINIKGLAIFLFACFYCHMTICGILKMCKENITFKVKEEASLGTILPRPNVLNIWDVVCLCGQKTNHFPRKPTWCCCIVWIVAWLMNDGTIKIPHSNTPMFITALSHNSQDMETT